MIIGIGTQRDGIQMMIMLLGLFYMQHELQAQK
jgi:hypothetical protein